MSLNNRTTGGPGAVPEATLFRQAQAGCRDSLNALMARHGGLVHAVVRRQVLGDLPFDEALHAGRIGLWRAILGFDPSRGLAFSTYAWPCIKHRVWRAVKAHTRFHSSSEINEALSPLQCQALGLLPQVAEPSQVLKAATVHRALHDLVRRLSPRLRYVVAARYGLNGHPPAFYRQIGVALGLCGERARQLHTEALVWLRHPAHSYTLRSLLDRHSLADYEAADALAQRWLRRKGGRYG
jgi:RNA polymerase sigma factor (sigma-70 family)